MRFALSEIPGGVAGTDETVREIARLVRYDLERPQLRLLATRLLRRHAVPSKSHESEARAIFAFVTQSVRYQKDPIDIETVQSPTVTLALGAGDCDDLSGLVAGLAMSVGIPARFRVIGYDHDHLVHIFPELFVAGRWWPADATEPARGFGWRPKQFPLERLYNLNGEVQNMAQLQNPTVKRGEVKASIKRQVADVLSTNWQSGLIDANDVRGYLDVIDQGNFPSREPLLVEPAREAIQEFADYVSAHRVGSLKPATSTGLEGLDGFLSSVWGAVKDGVRSMVGGSPQVGPGGEVQQPTPLVQISPTLTIPEGVVRAEATPAVAAAFGAGLGGATLPLLIMAGLATLFFLRK